MTENELKDVLNGAFKLFAISDLTSSECKEKYVGYAKGKGYLDQPKFKPLTIEQFNEWCKKADGYCRNSQFTGMTFEIGLQIAGEELGYIEKEKSEVEKYEELYNEYTYEDAPNNEFKACLIDQANKAIIELKGKLKRSKDE